MVTAGWMMPAGRATRVDRGFIVDGRWSFGSGCTHADVIIGGCLVFDRAGELEVGVDGLPIARIVMAPADRFEIFDTWHTTGPSSPTRSTPLRDPDAPNPLVVTRHNRAGQHPSSHSWTSVTPAVARSVDRPPSARTRVRERRLDRTRDP
jgi:alkylation response protein AidB-like acyl-CoA dehydrogenase